MSRRKLCLAEIAENAETSKPAARAGAFLFCHTETHIFNPRIGVRHEDLDYHGYEMRMLHVKKVSIVYAIIGQTVQILYVWNNLQDPKRLAKVLGLEK